MSSPGTINKHRTANKAYSDIPAVRRAKISDLVKRQGIVRVDELSNEFGVSVITIRRDLDILEKKGLVERTHGGAMVTDHLNVESAYSEKRQTYINIKQAIGEKAASLIEEGDALLVNSGTTTGEVIKALQFTKHLRVITNNVAVVRDLHPDASLELLFTGGSYRSTTCCVVGELSVLVIDHVYASKTILGVDGLSIKHGITSSNYQEALISRNMLAHSHGPVYVVADHSKIGKVTNFSIAPLEQISAVITDSLTRDVCRELQKSGVTLHLVKTSQSSS